jgi:hypothetical protein
MVGDYAEAARLYEASIAGYREANDLFSIATIQANMGAAQLYLGRHKEAAHHLRAAICEFLRWGEQSWGVTSCLIGLSAVAAATQQVRAVRLLAAARRSLDELESLGQQVPPTPGRLTYEHALAICHQAIDADTFAQAWAEGAAMSLEQAVAYELENSPIPLPAESQSWEVLPSRLFRNRPRQPGDQATSYL